MSVQEQLDQLAIAVAEHAMHVTETIDTIREIKAVSDAAHAKWWDEFEAHMKSERAEAKSHQDKMFNDIVEELERQCDKFRGDEPDKGDK